MQGLARGFDSNVEHRPGGSICCIGCNERTEERGGRECENLRVHYKKSGLRKGLNRTGCRKIKEGTAR